MSTDADLWRDWASGDREAGDAFVERHFDAIYRFFRNKVTGDVSDLVQRTFLACVEALPRYRGDASVRSYLYAIARHELYGSYRRRMRDDRLDFAVSSLHDLDPSPSMAAAVKQEMELLRWALGEIPLDLQIAIELYYFEDVKGADLTVALEIPSGTVRSRIRRGLDALRQRLGEMDTSETACIESQKLVESWHAELERTG